ncbi:peptide-methionine (R)-S-oxide reductase MsrB [Novosphingobium sp. SG720]|uniref:peptide-methionine (R)-S-oxide reductase MsrB n=1 Tax=Novosphingobium TaxID=165696 RepID=UPI0014482065|nr:peptide-methionine (R)-S-oxide reductase MsrB [Novosphingobium sp. SG720]
MTEGLAPPASRPSRRRLLGWLGAGLVMPMAGACRARPAPSGPKDVFPVQHSEAEWRRLLTPEQFYILREAGTERPFSSSLLNEHRKGTFACAADKQPLFASATKFESGTGWPSFWKPLPGAVGLRSDTTLGMERTEVYCRRCGGHLGHVFDDGPPPTGKRYCMNGKGMVFLPA